MFQVTERAADFYKEEMELNPGDSIRLFVRYGGGGVDGFTLGVDRGEAKPANVKATVGGISFYNDSEDDWLVDQVLIDLHEGTREIKLVFHSEQD